ncbi:MAG: response regulator transcription factor [Phycisphaerae bacterium]
MPRTARPTFEQARTVFRLVGDLRDLRGDPGGQRRLIVHSMCEILGARQGTALLLENFAGGESMRFREATHGGWANGAVIALWEELLHARQFDRDVVMRGCQDIEAARPAGERHRRPVARLRDQIVPDDVFYAAPLVRELLPVLEIDSHVCGWHTPGPGAPTLALTFHRDARDRPFAPREREVLQLFLEELAIVGAEGKLDPPPVAPAGRGDRERPFLSPRERAVLKHLLGGRSVKETAIALRISHRTTEDYVKALYRKYDVHSRGELMTRFVSAPELVG